MIPLGTERIVDSTEHNLIPKDHNCDTSIRSRVKENLNSSKRPRVINKIDSTPPDYDVQSDTNTAKEYILNKSLTVTAYHRYPTQLKVARAANTVQIEQAQIEQPKPVTYNFIPSVIEPPNQLKYKELIKGPQGDEWE